MLKRTHLALGALVALFLLPYVENKWIFVPIVLVASLLPDVDTAFSTAGRNFLSRGLQMFVKHRGVIHSLTFAVVVSLGLAFFWPVGALPFFLGYSFHLLADSFTPEGIKPFWPIKSVVKGRIRTGGRIEDTVFIVLLIFDVLLLVALFL
jgi:membrane-bound metal-dependent hydrolase YbcI (DUF457 family)